MPGKRLLALPGQQQTLLAQLLSRPMLLSAISGNNPPVSSFQTMEPFIREPSQMQAKCGFWRGAVFFHLTRFLSLSGSSGGYKLPYLMDLYQAEALGADRTRPALQLLSSSMLSVSLTFARLQMGSDQGPAELRLGE